MSQILLSAPDPDSCDAPTHEDVILYHHVWRTLRQGSRDRAALPPELVQSIVVYAGWMLPDRTRVALASGRASVKCDEIDPSAKASKRWFAYGPLTGRDTAGIAAVQLITVGRDQGWTSLRPPASFSWFEVGIERQGKLVQELQWKSHHNELCGEEHSRVDGAVIHAPRSGWEVGDLIVVFAYAQSYAWRNEAKKGALRFYKWFQPVIPLCIEQKHG